MPSSVSDSFNILHEIQKELKYALEPEIRKLSIFFMKFDVSKVSITPLTLPLSIFFMKFARV